jgi:hypothetical protein
LRNYPDGPVSMTMFVLMFPQIDGSGLW